MNDIMVMFSGAEAFVTSFMQHPNPQVAAIMTAAFLPAPTSGLVLSTEALEINAQALAAGMKKESGRGPGQ